MPGRRGSRSQVEVVGDGGRLGAVVEIVAAGGREFRGDAFLDAARSVAARDGVRAVTLVAIAAEAGLHHSALRRYFRSPKHLLLQLAADGWRGWADRLVGALDGRRLGPREVADVLVDTLVVDPLFCDLLGNVPLHLERDLPLDDVRAFKRAAMSDLARIVGAIAEAVPSLGEGGAGSLMTAANALAATLWQVAHPDDVLARLYREEPELGRHVGAFETTLRRLLDCVVCSLRRPWGRPWARRRGEAYSVTTTALWSRTASSRGGAPNMRRYSRVNWEALV